MSSAHRLVATSALQLRPSQVWRVAWTAAALLVVVAASSACAYSTSTSSTAGVSPSHPGQSPAPDDPSADPTADDAAPDELHGLWQATISTGEAVTLEFRSSGYTVNRAGTFGSGSISVDGSRIVFASARCELGSGVYEWAIEGETLTFRPLEPRDPCGNRIIFLENAAYTRVE
jgi:hypothetical protein